MPYVKLSFLRMFKSSLSKLLFFLLPIFAFSCNTWRTSDTANPNPSPSNASEIKSEIPFSTREPETYQMEVISQTYAGNETSERMTLMARKGEMRVTIFNYGKKNLITHLELNPQVTLLINSEKRMYAELSNGMTTSDETADDFLTTEWLNQKTPSTFERLETENNLSKFRVRLGEVGNSNSEILIFVDENLKFPVRQEFYSIMDNQRTLTFSVEIKNFKSEPEQKLFELPKDYRKVSSKEFQEIVRKEQAKDE